MQNRGLIITAYDWMNEQLSPKEREKLEFEYQAGASNTRIMTHIFNHFHITAAHAENVPLEELKKILTQTFREADQDSYSYIFIGCHGSPNGLSMINDPRTGSTVSLSYTHLRELLDQIPGIKVLMIDACYSGNSIRPDTAAVRSLNPGKDDSFRRQILEAFAAPPRGPMVRSGELRGSSYRILAACEPEQYAFFNNWGGCFTQIWCQGMGIDPGSKELRLLDKKEADWDGDGYFALEDLAR